MLFILILLRILTFFSAVIFSRYNLRERETQDQSMAEADISVDRYHKLVTLRDEADLGLFLTGKYKNNEIISVINK